MYHLRIELNGITELVDNSVIPKLYEIASLNTLDVSSTLVGRIHADGAYADEVLWLKLNYPDLHITSDKLYVRFLDPLAQLWCVTNFSSDGVGCSPEDLSSVTSNQFNGDSFMNSSIVNFGEFRYFTGVTSVDVSRNTVTGNGLNWTLKFITLPNSVTYIGGSGYGGGFCGYTALQSINIPDNCEINQAAFRTCTSLTNITFGNNVIIGSQAFYECTSLSNVDLTGVKSIGNSAFVNCTSLTSVNIPTSVNYIGYSFIGSAGVTSITFEEGGNTALVLEGGTSGYKPGVFRLTSSLKIVFPERLSELKNNALGCTSAMTYVFTSTTPPSVTGNGLITTDITNSKIYVPDSALADYKAATGFSDYASYIYPVSELPS